MFENWYLECGIKMKGDKDFMISFIFYMKGFFIVDVCGYRGRLFKFLNCIVENMWIYRKCCWKVIYVNFVFLIVFCKM